MVKGAVVKIRTLNKEGPGGEGQTGSEASPFTMTQSAHCSPSRQLELVWKPAEHTVNRQLQ